MNSYRRVLLLTILAAALLIALLAILSETGATVLLSLVLLAETLADALSTVYVLRLVLGDPRRPRSWLLLAILTSCFITTLGILPLGYTVVRRYLGQPPLPPGMGLLLVGMGLVLVGIVPVMKATLFYLVARDERRARTRSQTRRSTDPHDTDLPA